MTPSVSLSHPGEIVEGDPLILTCRTDPAISCRHRWFKKLRNTGSLEISDGERLVLNSTKSSDSAKYFCTVENELGAKMSEPVQVDVKCKARYSGVIVEDSIEHLNDEAFVVFRRCSEELLLAGASLQSPRGGPVSDCDLQQLREAGGEIHIVQGKPTRAPRTRRNLPLHLHPPTRCRTLLLQGPQ